MPRDIGEELEEGQTVSVYLYNNFIGVNSDISLFLLNYSQFLCVPTSRHIQCNLLCICVMFNNSSTTEPFLCVCIRYLCPLICLRVVGFHSVEIDLPIVTPYSIETVAKETDTNSISADAHGGYSCPRVSLRVIPVYAHNFILFYFKTSMKSCLTKHLAQKNRQTNEVHPCVCFIFPQNSHYWLPKITLLFLMTCKVMHCKC